MLGTLFQRVLALHQRFYTAHGAWRKEGELESCIDKHMYMRFPLAVATGSSMSH